jgi:uncharacterized protein
MLIQHEQKEGRGMFFIEEDGNILAEMTYSNPDPTHMIIEHTEVDDELKGQNVGFALVNHAVEYARTHQQKILPVCSFAKAVFDKKPDLQDVLDR